MKPIYFSAVLLGIGVMASVACTQSQQEEYWTPSLPAGIEAVENFDTLRISEIELGEKLFFSTLLSQNRDQSCASCHLPRFAFADTTSTSLGLNGEPGTRNTPSLFNTVWKEHYFAEGGVKTLHRATIAPMLVETEMFVQAPELMKRISEDSDFHKRFLDVYGEAYDYAEVVDALVAFQATLISLDSPYDQGKMTPSAQRGLALFTSDSLACSTCHLPPFFLDHDFHDLGMPIAEERDYGRGRFTFDSTDYDAFSTPSLRNVALTGPYMHDGSMETLDSVVKFYESGGDPVRSELKPFSLDDSGRVDLISFLNALTGEKADSLNKTH